MLSVSDNRKIGTGLLALGGIFLFLGVLFFFDAGLLAIGELFALGLTFTASP
ncbi:unnamed protein product, partial [Sphacelaria rigidula]